MWKLIRLYVLCLLVWVVIGACTREPREVQTQQNSYDLTAEVAAVRQQFMDAYQLGDAKALSELFVDKASFTGTVSRVWRQGREEIRTNWEQLFQRFPKSRIVFSDPVLQSYNVPPTDAVGDTTVVIDTGFFSMFMEDSAGQKYETHGKYSATRVKQNGRWMIVNLHTSTLPPPR